MRIAATLTGVVLAGAGSTAAHADTLGPLACPPDTSVNITSKTSYLIPASSSTFKDGSGGTITVSVTKASTIGATLSSSAEVSTNEIIAAGKVSVSASGTAKLPTSSLGWKYWETSS